MRTIETQIEINATVETVWAILMDFGSYSEWNPFVISIQGDQKLHEKLNVGLNSGDKIFKFAPKIVSYHSNEQFAWKGKLLLPYIFDGTHYFELEPTESGTLFIHREEFRGILVWPLLKMIGEDTRANFETMNRALKQRAES